MSVETRQTIRGCLDLALFAIYLLARNLFALFQSKVVWRLVGIADAPADRPVRLHSIVFRRKRDPEEISRIDDFVLTHHAFAPLAILEGPHWALYALDQKSAYFVQLPHPMTYYDVKKYPFLYIPLFEQAFCVAEISRANFLDLAERVSTRDQPATVFFTNTARCGSTLFAQMLHHEGVSVVYGEPYPLTILSLGFSEGYWSEQDLEELIGPVVNILRKDVPSDKICVLKTTSTEARLVPYTKHLALKHVFMFRKAGLDSVEKMLRRDPSMAGAVMLELYKLSLTISHWFGWVVACEGKLIRALRPRNLKEWAALIYASPYSDYLKYRDEFCLPIVWHHDIIHNTSNTLPAIFKEFGIPQDRIAAAMLCKNRDSQQGTFLSNDALKNITVSPYTEMDKERLRVFARFMAIPAEILLPE